MAKRRAVLITAAALVTSATTALVAPSPASAKTFTMTVNAPVVGMIGVAGVYGPGHYDVNYDIPPCSLNNTHLNWNSAGSLVGNTWLPDSKPGWGTLNKVRFELYPGPGCNYDPWVGNTGGVHFEADDSIWNIGQVNLPVVGQDGAFRADGDIISTQPIPDGRLSVHMFQLPTGYPDPPAPIKSNGIVEYGAFASSPSKGDRWTGGVVWPGHYIMFINDHSTGGSLTVLADLAPDKVPTIDLDAICFGFDICTQSPGAPAPVPGEFYPVPPTRILDTRNSLGITNGPVRTGDGRHSSLNPVVRRDEAANHDLKVTGMYGIPESGVSAVLLNVTAVNAPGPGYLSIVPKPARAGGGLGIFHDQGTYGALPSTSNLNVADGNAVPNMVLARVGAGGHIRIVNSWGPTHVIADVAGWFGTAGRHDDGAGFVGIVPNRLMDSRVGIGGPVERFDHGETRELKVAGVGGIPANAESVVLNITSVLPDRIGSYVTAWPKGEPQPTASNVNGLIWTARANMAVVKVGDGGKINLRSWGATDVIVDVMGSFGPYGGAVTAIEPQRSVDSRSGIGTAPWALGHGETRHFTIAGRAGVPANATAVIVNITSVGSSGGGYFTAYPTGAAQPNVSNLNFGAQQTVPNLAMLDLGDGGKISLFNAQGNAHVIVDVMGYVT